MMVFQVRLYLDEELVEATDLTICNPGVDRIVNDIADRSDSAQARETDHQRSA